jgi:hypothetical protein
MHLDEANFNFDQCVHVNYHRLQMMLASKMSLQFNNHLSYQISFYIEILYCILTITLTTNTMVKHFDPAVVWEWPV